MLQPEREGTISRRFILIEKSALFPETLRLANDLNKAGWASVANNVDLRQLEGKLFAAGWTFLYTAWTVRIIGFGLSGEL